jgi:hypothetical protein
MNLHRFAHTQDHTFLYADRVLPALRFIALTQSCWFVDLLRRSCQVTDDGDHLMFRARVCRWRASLEEAGFGHRTGVLHPLFSDS